MYESYVTIFQRYNDDGKLKFYSWLSLGQDQLRERIHQIGSSNYCSTVDISSDTAAQVSAKDGVISEAVHEANKRKITNSRKLEDMLRNQNVSI